MLDFTPIFKRALARRVDAAGRWRGQGIAEAQKAQLEMLTRQCARTEYGQSLGITAPVDYSRWRQKVPVAGYAQLRPWVMRMVAGEADVLWPGVTRRFAQSSGTSDGRSKFIPVTASSLRLNHYRGAADAVAHYLHNYPDSRMFAGRGFILGGSFANTLTADTEIAKDVRVGDLSANLIEAINPVVNFWRVPSKRVALIDDWTVKLPELVQASMHANVTNISGVPSWFLTVIKQVIAAAGATTIHDVWPNLEVFIHGGIAMGPYRQQYAALTDPARMHYVETYNASEGFFAVQDLREPDLGMLLLLDAGVFYEFVPVDIAVETDDPHPAHAVPAWQVEPGRTYALVITAANGLWRYPIGDTVRVVSADPLRIVIAGRTRHFINAFGEEVMVHNTDTALARACADCHAAVADYHVAPVYAGNGTRGRHQWFIEWAQPPQAGTEAFADALDVALQAENSDYAAKRAGGIFLDRLSITALPSGTFERWLASTGKLGGQRKVPRLSNDRKIAEQLLRFIKAKPQ